MNFFLDMSPKNKPPNESESQEYALEIMALLKKMVPSEPEDPLHPIVDDTNPLDKLSPTKLVKLKAHALDALSIQLQQKQPGVELQTICNKVMDTLMDNDNVVRLKSLDASGRKYEQRFVKIFKPRHLKQASPRSIHRKVKTMMTVMNLLSFDYQEQQEVSLKFAIMNGLRPEGHEEKPKKRRHATKPLALPVLTMKRLPPVLVTRTLNNTNAIHTPADRAHRNTAPGHQPPAQHNASTGPLSAASWPVIPEPAQAGLSQEPSRSAAAASRPDGLALLAHMSSPKEP